MAQNESPNKKYIRIPSAEIGFRQAARYALHCPTPLAACPQSLAKPSARSRSAVATVNPTSQRPSNWWFGLVDWRCSRRGVPFTPYKKPGVQCQVLPFCKRGYKPGSAFASSGSSSSRSSRRSSRNSSGTGCGCGSSASSGACRIVSD